MSAPLRFDFVTLDHAYDRANIYLLDVDGNQLNNEQPTNFLIPDVRNQLYLDLPLSQVTRYFPALQNVQYSPTPSGGTLERGQFRLKLAVYPTSGDVPALAGGARVTGAFTVESSGNSNPFGTELPQAGVLHGELYGVDWDNTTITASCVVSARHLVEYFDNFYGQNATLPMLGDLTNTNFSGAARLMMSGTYSLNGNTIPFQEIDVPGFTKVYMRNLAEGTLPPPGALIVWDTDYSGSLGLGHIATVISSNSSNHTVRIIEGNYDSGRGTIRDINNFDHVLGWLIPSQSN